MATRATYQFRATGSPETTVYCHYDGYPEGAAQYFLAMLETEGKGGWCDRFIKGNAEAAEITTSHEYNRTIEYCYTVRSGLNLVAEKRSDDGQQWDCFFADQVDAFINQYAAGDSRLPVVGTDTQRTLLKQHLFTAVDFAKTGWISSGHFEIDLAIEIGQTLEPVKHNAEIQALMKTIKKWYRSYYKSGKPNAQAVVDAGLMVQKLLKGH